MRVCVCPCALLCPLRTASGGMTEPGSVAGAMAALRADLASCAPLDASFPEDFKGPPQRRDFRGSVDKNRRYVLATTVDEVVQAMTPDPAAAAAAGAGEQRPAAIVVAGNTDLAFYKEEQLAARASQQGMKTFVTVDNVDAMRRVEVRELQTLLLICCLATTRLLCATSVYDLWSDTRSSFFVWPLVCALEQHTRRQAAATHTHTYRIALMHTHRHADTRPHTHTHMHPHAPSTNTKTTIDGWVGLAGRRAGGAECDHHRRSRDLQRTPRRLGG